MKISGIYKIQSILKPHKVYIGSAISISGRWNLHLSRLRRNIHDNKKLQSHFNKYGESDFQFSILLGCDKEDLVKTEQYFIDSYHPWFNNRMIANSNLGLKASEETKKKTSESLKKRFAEFPHSDETRNKMRIAALERPPISDKTKLNMRKARKKQKKAISQYDKQGNFIRDWECINDAHRELNIDDTCIGKVAKGYRPSAGGFIWKYKLIS